MLVHIVHHGRTAHGDDTGSLDEHVDVRASEDGTAYVDAAPGSERTRSAETRSLRARTPWNSCRLLQHEAHASPRVQSVAPAHDRHERVPAPSAMTLANPYFLLHLRDHRNSPSAGRSPRTTGAGSLHRP